MTIDRFFRGVVQTDIRIRERPAKSPLFYPRLSMMGFVLTVDYATARSLMPTPMHRPWQVLPGRALLAVHCFEYEETGIGPYNELALTIAIDHGPPRMPLPWRLGRSVILDEYHGHVVDLPVTTEVALHGGLDYFNYPKYLADISFDEDAATRTCTVRDRESGEMILRASGPRLATSGRGLRVAIMHSYPVVDGITKHATFRINQQAKGERYLPSWASIVAGSHARAALFRRLSPGRPLQYFHVPQAQGILYMPSKVGGLPGEP